MNKEEIDKWLYIEYGMTYTTLENVLNFTTQQNVELQDKLKQKEQALQDIKEYVDKKDKEIERLNNKIKRIAYQCYKSDMSYEEFKQIWVNAMGKIYEPSQIDELEKELGVDKE